MVGCAALKCTNSSDKNYGKKISFVRFPRDERLLQIWTRACGHVKITPNSRLCTDHFSDDQFLRLAHTTKLIDFAVPTIFSFKVKEPIQKIMTALSIPSAVNVMDSLTMIVPDGNLKIIYNANDDIILTQSMEFVKPLRAPLSINKGKFYLI